MAWCHRLGSLCHSGRSSFLFALAARDLIWPLSSQTLDGTKQRAVQPNLLCVPTFSLSASTLPSLPLQSFFSLSFSIALFLRMLLSKPPFQFCSTILYQNCATKRAARWPVATVQRANSPAEILPCWSLDTQREMGKGWTLLVTYMNNCRRRRKRPVSMCASPDTLWGP